MNDYIAYYLLDFMNINLIGLLVIGIPLVFFLLKTESKGVFFIAFLLVLISYSVLIFKPDSFNIDTMSKIKDSEKITEYYNVEVVEKNDKINISFKQKENKGMFFYVFYLKESNFEIEKKNNNIFIKAKNRSEKQITEEELKQYIKQYIINKDVKKTEDNKLSLSDLKQEGIFQMNKIYNNLNIDNLMKTEEFKDFNREQKEEIRTGLLNGLDVSIYAKKEFDEYQMREIRYGLEDNLDVSVYAKSEFDYNQMFEIRKGLEDNLNVSVYAKTELDSKEMAQSRGRMLLRKSTLLQCTLFYCQKNSFLKIFWIAQNRFQIFDVDISTFVAPEKLIKNTKNATHVQQSRPNVKIAQNRFI